MSKKYLAGILMLKRLIDRIINSAPVQGSINLSKNIRVSTSYDVSLYTAIRFIIRELRRNDISAESKSVAFNFTLAIFPFIIFLFTLLPHVQNYVGVTESDINIFLEENLPDNIYEATSSTINDLVMRRRDGLLSIGFLLAMFMSTNGMMALMNAFNRCYRTVESRNYFKKRLTAFFLTILLIVVLFLTLLLIAFGGIILQAIQEQFDILQQIDLLRFLQYLSYIFIFFGAISIIYYFAPSIKKRWRFISMGSVVATSLSIFLSLGFSYYVSNFATYNKVYGSIGTLIAVMLWIQMMALILLLGFEINAGMDKAKEHAKKL